MKVILLKDVKGLGRKYEEKTVSDGHAYNFLIPQKLAVPTNSASAREALAQMARELEAHTKADENLKNSVAQIAGTILEIRLKANEQGHLFEKLTAEKLSEHMAREKNLHIDPNHFVLESAIKQTGTHKVPVDIGGKETYFTLEVVALS